MADLTYPLFPTLAFLGSTLSLVPLPWHLQSGNSGTCLYMFWAALSSLNFAVNSVVWHDNVLNVAPVWCDISSRIIIASAVGLPAASLSISRRLYNISKVNATAITWTEKRRSIIFDCLLCIGFPLVCLVFYYCMEGHRFNIYENIGCFPATVNNVPSMFLVQMWPIVLGLCSGTYNALSFYALLRRQHEFKAILSTGSSLTMSRYVRLMALAMTDIALTVPLAVFSMYLNIQHGIAPYKGWADVHWDFHRVDMFPSVIWHISHLEVVSLELSRWLGIFPAFVFFAFFGFAEEARKHYRLAFWAIMMRFGVSSPAARPTGARPIKRSYLSHGGSVLPVHVAALPSKPRANSLSHSLAETVDTEISYQETDSTLTDGKDNMQDV